MNRLIIILLLLVCTVQGISQYDPEKVNKKAAEL